MEIAYQCAEGHV